MHYVKASPIGLKPILSLLSPLSSLLYIFLPIVHVLVTSNPSRHIGFLSSPSLSLLDRLLPPLLPFNMVSERDTSAPPVPLYMADTTPLACRVAPAIRETLDCECTGQACLHIRWVQLWAMEMRLPRVPQRPWSSASLD